MPDFSKKYVNPQGIVTQLPYYIVSDDGDTVYETTTLTDQQIAGLDWHPLTELNVDYDPDIQLRTSQTLNFANKTLTYGYSFVPNVREILAAKIDEKAEIARSAIATSAPLQTMEYAEAARQAKAYIADPNDTNEDWAFLLADIGHTLKQDGTVVTNLYQAAQTVLAAQAGWAYYAGMIRTKRLTAKAEIRDANTDAEAYEIYKAVVF